MPGQIETLYGMFGTLNIEANKKQMLQERYLTVLKEFKKRACILSILFYGMRVSITVGSILVPAFISIQGTNIQLELYWTTWMISIVVTICNGIIALFKIDKNSSDMNVHIHKYFASSIEYSAIKTFYNGQPNIIASINNICNYKPRTLLIIEILKDILNKEKDRKILILSERKNQLKDIEEFLKQFEMLDYGYYIGGMKMNDLDISATKQIILATYQMSSEGLNIPTLNTLILASPIGDIQQSVGRILREKKENRKYTPLCIDIFDELSVVKSKGFRRLKYYKSNGYIIKNYIDNLFVNDAYEEENVNKDFKDLFINDD